MSSRECEFKWNVFSISPLIKYQWTEIAPAGPITCHFFLLFFLDAVGNCRGACRPRSLHTGCPVSYAFKCILSPGARTHCSPDFLHKLGHLWRSHFFSCLKLDEWEVSHAPALAPDWYSHDRCLSHAQRPLSGGQLKSHGRLQVRGNRSSPKTRCNCFQVFRHLHNKNR